MLHGSWFMAHGSCCMVLWQPQNSVERCSLPLYPTSSLHLLPPPGGPPSLPPPLSSHLYPPSSLIPPPSPSSHVQPSFSILPDLKEVSNFPIDDVIHFFTRIEIFQCSAMNGLPPHWCWQTHYNRKLNFVYVGSKVPWLFLVFFFPVHFGLPGKK